MVDWISGNRFLTMTEMQNNAQILYGFFNSKGATLNAVAAMLGNMQSESTINPGRWEIGHAGDTNYGFGLTQWTPATKLINWAPSNWRNGTTQCERIWWEARNNEQWFHNPHAPDYEPPITFAEFLNSSLDVVTLANYFLWYYEHPANSNQPIRGQQAEAWYTYLSGETPPDPPDPPGPEPPVPQEIPKLKFMYFCYKKF